MNIVNQSYWDDSYKEFDFFVANDEVTSFLDEWINHYFEKNEFEKSCFEIGCYPGRYLSHVALNHKFVANGVDNTSALDEKFLKWLEANGVEIGNIIKGDAFSEINLLSSCRCFFDLVYSVGFIEHFDNYLDVISIHGDIVKKGGMIIITTPNFNGFFQRIFHFLLDYKNYKRHVITSMNPDKWKQLMEKKGYKILYYGFFGNFDFWVDYQKRNIFQNIIIRIINKSKNFLKKIIKKNTKSFSPYCGIVMIKQ